jgi:hypothetical protein
MRALSTAIVAVFLCLQPASAQECVPPQLLAAQAIQAVPDARIAMIVHGEQAQAIVAGYNAIPPVSHLQAESVAVLQSPSRPYVMVIAFTGNCTVFADPVPIEIFQNWVGQGT